jgi:hypothetical protein
MRISGAMFNHKNNYAFKCGDDFAMTMEAVRTSETSVNFYDTTQHNNPERPVSEGKFSL